MASMVFKKDEAGIRKLLQSTECLQVIKGYAQKMDGDKLVPFIGFDRAKCFVGEERKKK